MATKKIQIEFDLNTNEVKLAGEATLSLAQQVKILQRELQKTPEGTREFELLRKKLNDTRDNFDRVNAKSRELFGTLSLLPGPVGEIAGKLNGAISLFKTFSGFSFKDLRNQFTGLIDDIKGVFENLGRWGETTREITSNVDDLDNSTGNLNSTLANVSSNAGAAGDSVAKYSDELANQIKTADANIASTKKQIDAVSQLEQKRYDELIAIGEVRDFTAEESAEIDSFTQKQMQLSAELDSQIEVRKNLGQSIQSNTIATNTLTKAQQAAATAGRVLKGVLASIGIGLLIIGITTLITKIYEWATSTEDADEANENLGETIEQLNRILEDNLALIDEEVEANILRAKIAGKTQKDIQQIERQGFQDRIAILKKGIKDLENEEMSSNFLKLTKDQQKERSAQILNDRNKLNDQILKIESQARLFELKLVADSEEEKRKKRKEYSEKYIKDKEEEKQRLKAQLDAQIQLEIDSENTRLTELERLLEERFLLEEGSAAELELLFRNNQKKVQEAIDEDIEKKRQKKLTEIQALVEIEQSQAEVDTENLIQLLENRRDIELREVGLTAEQKLAIQAKYEADFRKLRQEAREEQLVEDIQANRGNFEKQIQLYRDFANEVVNSENYTAAEKLRIQEETNNKIEELEQQRFDDRVNQLQLNLGADFAYEQTYYDQLFDLYDQEEQRYKELRDSQAITEAEFNQKMLELRDARIQLRQEELQSQVAQLVAVSEIFGAAVGLVGEQTKLGKAFGVANATINTYVAANQVLASQTIPPFLKGLQAAAIIIRGLANVRRILQVQVPTAQKSEAQFSGGVINVNQRRAQGGMINGFGGETSDNIPALLSDGEYVVNARSTRVFRPLLETINSASNLPAFAVGGLVGGNQPVPFKSQNETIADAITTAFGSTPIRTYVTATEVSTQQQFDRIIKSRSLI